MALIRVEGLTLHRSGQAALQEVSFTVEQGETLVIIGPSGGGKSSLLRCLNRLEEPGPGHVFLDGQDITGLEVVELRRRVGMIFQKTAPFPGTIAENIAFGRGLKNESLSRERILELMELASLDPGLADRPASELSGGQEQRMAIARALALEPDVLLLDEPTSALDPIATHHVEESLFSLRAKMNLTLVWVSHQIEQARRVGERVLYLEKGRVLRIDSVANMLDAIHGDPRVLAFAAGEESSSS
jgi:putative ABC transport system ATP-binding protein